MTQQSPAVHYIDGAWVDEGRAATSHDPATGREIGTYKIADRALTDRAITAAKRTFAETTWKDDRHLRARVLNAMADRFEEHAEEVIAAICLENGKIRPHAEVEMSFVPDCLRFNAALALADMGHASSIAPGTLDMVIREAVGVAGVIAPWNAPAALSVRSVAPALAAGCTVVLSLPPQTAQANALIARIIAETPGLPAGVFNFVQGDAEVGDEIVKSPDVPTISFTGSTKTARIILANGAPFIKRFGLELGGKTPLVVFEDADVDAVVAKQVLALTVFAGQFCMTGSRILVQQSIADEVRAKLVDALSAVKLGPAADASSMMGPMIDKANVERVDKMVEDAIAKGATCPLRGGPVTEGELASGAFYAPTLLEVDDESMDVVQQEIFGPVLTMETFETEAEAVRMANATEYGLSASIWSRDIDRPLRVARKVEAGTIWINEWALLFDQFEEGGFKQSGSGRMRGLAVIDDFVEFKHISLHPGVVAG